MNENIDAKLPAQPEHNADGTVKPGYLPVAPIEHKPRVTDTDPKAARRAERQVASMFALSMVLVVVFVIAAVACFRPCFRRLSQTCVSDGGFRHVSNRQPVSDRFHIHKKTFISFD